MERRLQAEDEMKCVVCKTGDTRPGKTTVTLERGASTLVFKGVPAEVCDNCREAYVDESISGQLLRLTDEACRLGVKVDVREFTRLPA